MLTDEEKRELTTRFRARIDALSTRTSDTVATAWDALSNYDSPAPFTRRVAPVTKAAKQAAVAQGNAYYSLMSGNRPASVAVDAVATAFDSEAPFVAYRNALGNGRAWEEAVSAGRSRAESTAAGHVVSSARLTGDQVLPDVEWGRVASGTACAFCQEAASGVYNTAETADFGHERCSCSVVPLDENASAPSAVEEQIVDQIEAEAEGFLDRTQYEAMQPDRQWSEEKRQAILDALRADDNGKILADTLDKFQDGGSISRLRTNIEKRLAGEALDRTSAARADAIIDALRHAPTDLAPDKLFRGMSVKGVEKNVLAKYTVGDTLDLNLTSFTTDRKIAVKFQSMMQTKGTTRVMVELVGPDKRLLPIQNLARDRRLFAEKEWVGGGRYEILEVKKSPSGGVLLRIMQKATL